MKNKLIPAIVILIIAVGICCFAFTENKTENISPNNNDNEFIIRITDRCRKTGIEFSDKKPFFLNNFLPKDKNDYQRYDRKYFQLGYSNKDKQAAWVGWLLTKQMVLNKTTKRLDNFREDSLLRCCRSYNEDYKKSGYARGHLCPSADMLWSREANSTTFLLSNMSPQNKELNDGKWNELEQACRMWAIKNDSLLIITGPILTNPKGAIGKHKVTVPSRYFKIIVDISFPRCKAIAFVMPNEPARKRLFLYATSIKEVEKLTGLNFFPQYDNHSLIQRLESMCDTTMWK